jgi:hypothetical protein
MDVTAIDIIIGMSVTTFILIGILMWYKNNIDKWR